MGADAVEPDIVSTRDGVLVLRHENEISGTTDVASHSRFANRRTTKTIDGKKLTGWFTEDFTWDELQSLRSRERLPKVRQANTTFNHLDGILRLSDLIAILDASDRQVGMVAEIKHATYFASIGLPLDELFAAEVKAAGWGESNRLTIECFELTVLQQIRDRGIRGDLVYLLEAAGSPADNTNTPYSAYLTDEGLAALSGKVDGISVDKRLLLHTDVAGNTLGLTDVVDRAHAAGLTVYCWTLRAENRFLGKNLQRGSSPGQFGDWLGEFQLIMASGIDGVFADHPDLAVEARARL
ncbi:MAG: glycerophosphodiester phosphodiesterase [Homoserinimonas sp.]|nr:glycerophosphodiester phosphodiesterase [Homoserinimonas sp.]